MYSAIHCSYQPMVNKSWVFPSIGEYNPFICVIQCYDSHLRHYTILYCMQRHYTILLLHKLFFSFPQPESIETIIIREVFCNEEKMLYTYMCDRHVINHHLVYKLMLIQGRINCSYRCWAVQKYFLAQIPYLFQFWYLTRKGFL